MNICTQTDILSQRFGDEGAVEIISKNGFDYIDYSMFAMNNPDCPLCKNDDYLEHAKKLKNKAAEYGKTFWQAHSPFPSNKKGDDFYNEFIVKSIKRSLEICGVLGVKVCVVHPITRNNPDEQHEINMKLYRELESTAEANGVKIALENMWAVDPEKNRIWHAACSRPEEFNAYLDELGRDNFTACLDLGHCGLVDIPAQDMIRAMGGERITALHVHDNDNLHDSHTLPFTKSMNWTEITKALHDINYSGVFTFEADNFIVDLPSECSAEASKVMESTGRLLTAMIGL